MTFSASSDFRVGPDRHGEHEGAQGSRVPSPAEESDAAATGAEEGARRPPRERFVALTSFCCCKLRLFLWLV